QSRDEECKFVTSAIIAHWKESKFRKSLFFKYKDHLTIQTGLVMFDNRIFIPRGERKRILQQVHDGHFGIEKCKARMRRCVWWPGAMRELKNLISTCETCIRFTQNRPEPLLASPLPSLPWQIVGVDLFNWEKGDYLVMQDYFSRYLIVEKVGST